LKKKLTVALLLPVFLALGAEEEQREFFEMKVRPLLARECLACHGPSKMGGLVMDSREALLKGGNSGPAVVPERPGESLLVEAVRHTHARLKMPPAGKLAPRDIEILEEWIRSGAYWPPSGGAPGKDQGAGYAITPEQRSFWSFQPIRKPAPPPVRNTQWPASAIDRFVLAKLEENGLQPGRPADRRTLIRRAYYDLIGLPPTMEEVEAFVNDRSPEAFARVVDRLLASPHYGERWGRYWLDVARYSDDRLNSTQDDPYPNAYRYRDWVIQAFNEDMPYNVFLKAQIAGDVMDAADKERYIAGLGLFALSPEFQDDRVDALSRGMLGLTVACAQCHDHKFDPIPTQDYYSLLGVFRNTRLGEYPLAPPEVVNQYKQRQQDVKDQEKRVKEYMDSQANQLAEILAGQTAAYLAAARPLARAETGPPREQIERVASEASLDAETLERWIDYLRTEPKEHPYLDNWRADSFDAQAFGAKLLATLEKKKEIDRENLIRLGGKDDNRTIRVVEVLSLERDAYFLWRDFFNPTRAGKRESGVLYYAGEKLDRFLSGPWKAHLDALRAELRRREQMVPEQYPFYQIIVDVEQPKDIQIEIRGDQNNLGEVAPRRFLQILCQGEPKRFTRGSGRLELAEAVASESNPLTARVMANRIWLHHFGRGIVNTPGNFGQLGERPTHPELLDWLAARFMELGWSMKKLHREIMLSKVYQLSASRIAKNEAVDPDNKLFWRANRRRLDVEPLRDTLLAVTGELDRTVGGPPLKITEGNNRRRTVYCFVSRRKLDGTLALFDFPNPVSLSEQRIHTATPLQQLFFLNSEFIEQRAAALAERLQRMAADETGRIRAAYRSLYQRAPSVDEIHAGLSYLKSPYGSWPRYAQALLSSNELLFVN
jgi:mono/diheme cytochrome c family protein